MKDFMIGNFLVFVGGGGVGIAIGIRLMSGRARRAIETAFCPRVNQESDVNG